jgi:hypothetical protein
LRSPSPNRVWALSAFAEPVDLGPQSHYRLTPGSIATALAAGIERDQIVGFLERGSRRRLPPALAANLAAWARDYRRVRLRRAVILQVDDSAERSPLLQTLREGGWEAEPVGETGVLVSLTVLAGAASPGATHGEDELVLALRVAGHAPRWVTAAGEETEFAPASGPSDGQLALPEDNEAVSDQ